MSGLSPDNNQTDRSAIDNAKDNLPSCDHTTRLDVTPKPSEHESPSEQPPYITLVVPRPETLGDSQEEHSLDERTVARVSLDSRVDSNRQLSEKPEIATGESLCEARKVDASQRSIMQLNSKIAVSAATTLGIQCFAIGLLLPQLIQTAPGWLLTYGAAVIGLGVALRAGAIWHVVQKNLQPTHADRENAATHSRIQNSLARLTEKAKRPLDFHVRASASKFTVAAMIDRIFHKDILLLNQDLIAQLSDSELDGLIAHEACHSNRAHGKFAQTSVFLHPVASSTIFWGTALPVFNAVSASAGFLVGSGAALVAATSTWALALCSIAAARLHVSRLNELKTDIRAVQITREPEAYISVLEKAVLFASNGKRAPFRIPDFVSTHPSQEVRTQNIRKVFGA